MKPKFILSAPAAPAILTVLLLGFFLSRWIAANAKVQLYLSTDLTPHHSGPRSLLPKERSLAGAALLFVDTRANGRLELHLADSGGNPALSSRQVLDFAARSGPKLVFAPTGSDAIPGFLNTARNEGLKLNTFFLSQVTATTQLHDAFRAVSSYLPAQDYFKGVFPLILQNGPRPRSAHILRRQGVGYFEELAAVARRELESAGIPMGEEIEVPHQGGRAFLKEWNEKKIRAGDWLVVIDFANSPRLAPIAASRKFLAAVPIFTYGSYMRHRVINPERFRNSWHILNWHPWLEFAGHGAVSNCEFVRAFWDRFGYIPRFHGAYLYALLEALEQISYRDPFRSGGPEKAGALPTILGPLQWNERGVPVGKAPLLLYFGSSSDTLFVSEDVLGPCPESRVPLQGTAIVRPSREGSSP